MLKQENKSKNRWIFIVLVAVLAIVGAVFIFQPKIDSLPATITVQQAKERIENGTFLLDVREQNEWDEAHVDGAVLIPLGELSARINEIPTNQDVVVICRSGNRSGTARDLLRDAGLTRTTSIAGGITAWISAGLPVVSGP